MPVELRAKIGGVRRPNLAEVQDRFLISRLRALSPKEAKERNYQTKWPALVPETPPRNATSTEIASFTTPEANAPHHIIFLKPSEKALSAIEAEHVQDETIIPLEERPYIELAPGIDGHLAAFIPTKANMLTAGYMSYTLNPHAKDDPDFPENASMGIHFDYGNGTPLVDLLNNRRRLIVNLGDSPRYSLLGVPITVFDTSQILHRGDMEYVPLSEELLPHLGEHTEDLTVVWTRLDPGDAYILPAHALYHDGSTYEQGASNTAVLFEPQERWLEEDLLANSLF